MRPFFHLLFFVLMSTFFLSCKTDFVIPAWPSVIPSNPKPTITSFAPSSAAEGATVTITGTNFTGTTDVRLNGVAIGIYTIASATSITFSVPAGSTSGALTVTTPNGTATSANNLNVGQAAMPTITSFSPASGAPGSTVVLTGTGFTGVTVVSLNSGAVDRFTVDSPTQITATLTASNTTGKFKVTHPQNGTGTSATSFTVTGATTDPVVLVPAISDFSYNVRSANDAPATPVHSALSVLGVYAANAPYVDIEYTATRPALKDANGVYIDRYGVSVNSAGSLDAEFIAEVAGDKLTKRLTFNNNSAGRKDFIERVQERGDGDAGSFGQVYITKLTFPAGSTAYFQKPPANGDVLYVVGDSKSVEVYSTTGWIRRLRAKRPNMDIYSDGWGFRRASVALANSTLRAAILANVARLGITRLCVALATNDKVAGLDPSTVMGLVGQLADEARAYPGLSNILFYVELEYDNSTSANNAWRSAAKNLQNGRGTWFRIIDPGSPATADGTHANDPGQQTVCNAYDAQLDLTPTLASPVLLHAWEGNNTPAVWYDQGAGNKNATQSVEANRPSLVDNAVFGKRAYKYTAASGIKQYMKLQALFSQSGEFSIILVIKALSTISRGFPLDAQTGRFAIFQNGWAGAPNAQAAYYISDADGNPSGARGPILDFSKDTIVGFAIGNSSSSIFQDGGVIGTGYAAGVTRLLSELFIGVSYDVDTTTPDQQAEMLLAALEVIPGKITAAQFEARRQALGAVASSATTASGYIDGDNFTVTSGSFTQAANMGGPGSGHQYYSNNSGDAASVTGKGNIIDFYSGQGSGSQLVEVFNSSGGKVFSTPLQNSQLAGNNALNLTIDLSNFGFGSYTLVTTIQNNTFGNYGGARFR